MSHDQRPAKVRVVAVAPATAAPVPEGGPASTAPVTAAVAASGAGATLASPGGARLSLASMALYLAGCAGGGAGAAFLLRGLGAL